MIHRKEAERQVWRLIVLPGMTERNAASDEITDALERHSQNSQHADRIVTELLDAFASTGTLPSPAQIIKLASRTDPEFDPREWRCSECGETAFRYIFQLHTWSAASEKPRIQIITRELYERLRLNVSGVLGEQLVTPAVEYCACSLGRRRVSAIYADKIEEAAKAAKKAREKQSKNAVMRDGA